MRFPKLRIACWGFFLYLWKTYSKRERTTCSSKLLGRGRFNLSMGHFAKAIRMKLQVVAAVNKQILTAAIVIVRNDLNKLPSCDIHDLSQPKRDKWLLYLYIDLCSDGPSKQVSLYFFSELISRIFVLAFSQSFDVSPAHVLT